MPRVSTETIFPGLTVTGDAVTIPLADLPGLTAALAAGASSDIRALAYAFDVAIAERVNALDAAVRPTGFTKTIGTQTIPATGRQTIPVATTYTVKDNLATQQLIDEV